MSADLALELARRFHVFPLDHPSHELCQGIKTKMHDPRTCKERGKHPCPAAWSEWSTQDPTRLAQPQYFGGGRLLNIAIDCGKSGVFVVDEDAMGEWERLCTYLGIEHPKTFTVRTAHGRHFYFLQPPGVPLGNTEGGVVKGYTMNIRGAGGYVVAPGSLHETGVVYEVIDDSEIAEPPDALVAELRSKSKTNGQHRNDTGFATINEGKDHSWWRDTPTIVHPNRHNAMAAAAGWARRMGLKLDEAKPYVRDVWTRCDGDKYTLDDAYACLDDIYSRYEAGNRLEERRDADEHEVDQLASWHEVDLTAALEGRKTRAQPTILKRSDGRYMLYEGQINYLHGADSVGKSFVALFAAVEVMDAGGHVVWLDWEDPDEATIVARLLDLGVSPKVIAERFHYLHPDSEATLVAVGQVCELINRHHARLVVVDSVGEAMGIDGVNEDKDNEVTPWFRRVLRPLAATGAGVLPIDHGIKSGDNPLHPSGSKRKRAMVTGAHFMVEAPRPISQEYSGGQLKLTCAKDRHGNYTRGKAAAVIDVAIYPDGGWTVHIHPPAAPAEEASNNDRALARAMARVVRDLEEETGTPPSLTQVEQSKRVKGGVTAKRAALEYAVACGAVKETEGPRNARLFTYVKDLETAPNPDPVPPRPDPVGRGGHLIQSDPVTPSPPRGTGYGTGSRTPETDSTPEPTVDGVDADLICIRCGGPPDHPTTTHKPYAGTREPF